MISSRPAKAAILAAAFAFAPVIAQGEPHDPLPHETLDAIGLPASGSYDVAIDNNMDVIGQYLHQQPVEPASDLKDEAVGWFAWGKDAIVTSGHYAGDWIAARSEDAATVSHHAYEWLGAGSSFMAATAYDASEWVSETSRDLSETAQGMADWIAAHDPYEWLSASSSFMAATAHNTSEWVSETSQDLAEAAQETTDWIAAETTVAAQAATGHVDAALDGAWITHDWSQDFIDEVKKKLQEDKTSDFAKLVSASGFALTNVVVGVGLIPSLDVEFRHERDLSPEERAEFEKMIQAYAEKTSGLIGYLETILLRNLARAGKLSGGLRIGELHVDLFPLPGLDLFFDPFHVEKKRDEMLFSSDEHTRTYRAEFHVLEQRIKKLEAELAAIRSGAAITSQ